MKSSGVDLSLILPCYNETALFTESVKVIQDVLDASRFSYEIILVDDASSDGTQKLIRDFIIRRGLPHDALGRDAVVLASSRSRSLFVRHGYNAKAVTMLRNSIPPRAIFHKVNQGRGRTVVDGIRRANGTVVGFIDIDCEVSPVYIPSAVSLILQKQADVVIGRRYYRTTVGSMVREILSRGYQWLSQLLIGTGGLDTETGYKFFLRRKIVPIVAKTKHTGWFWDTEIMVLAKRAGLRIIEMPVLFLRRFDKRSSVNIFRDTSAYLSHLWKFHRMLRDK